MILDVSMLLALFALGASVALYMGSGRSVSFSASAVSDGYYMRSDGEVLSTPVEDSKGMYLLDLPVKSQDEVIRWASIVSAELHSFSFRNYESHFNGMRDLCTNEGWQAVSSAFLKSQLLGDVITKKLSVSSIVTGKPALLKHGMQLGAYSWLIQVPLLVTYESASEKRNVRRVATIDIRRVPFDLDDGKAGIAVNSIRVT
ncbi:DotI/IcmL family type IV secretion protein [Candidatus Comchoanobacter bicostacola]|uniref:DotI/IcmL family type IV secretion protein n=1 Tax=Candidatus Comchoanobacter bicostacola TaxID=2919598 RepID=A0ABY5DIF9_9GAMM|nr:DotI/IcmL family type IV secretion protein [Candidatus Comchoanobacter bicostacola]UTC24403.1 DotI/IcmL family type IV secretion protein [Candidatus Comchoanobacter bicostacola]